jgi:hypothetical protein
MSQPAISPSPGPPTTAVTLREGSYVTDESNLFRCISIDTSHREATVELEDCLTLAVIIMPLSEVSRVSLRVVR